MVISVVMFDPNPKYTRRNQKEKGNEKRMKIKRKRSLPLLILTFKYLNYKEVYTADNNMYLFWYHHFDRQ